MLTYPQSFTWAIATFCLTLILVSGSAANWYEVRLSPPPSKPTARNTGTVLVRYNSSSPWGTLCGNSWDKNAARVVCRMLGFPGAMSAYTTAPSGAQEGFDMVPFDVNCTGTEAGFYECTSNMYESYDCGAGEQAGVTCAGYEVRLEPFYEESTARIIGAVLIRSNSTSPWGTVSFTFWDINDATVACKMLGFHGAISTHLFSPSGVLKSYPMLLLEVNCTGTEDNLAECWSNKYIKLDLKRRHLFVAGVECVGRYEAKLEPPAGEPSAKHKGTLLVRYNSTSQWGTVCDNGWDIYDARVACRMLGFLDAVSHHTSSAFGALEGYKMMLNEVDCTGTESEIFQCRRNLDGEKDCGVGEQAGVTCYWYEVKLEPPPSDPTAVNKGTVLVRYNSTSPWGTICGNTWDSDGAEVVCKMLGFNGAVSHQLNSDFGALEEYPVVLDGASCIGTERNLDGCRSSLNGMHYCNSSERAGVTCEWYEVRLEPFSWEPTAVHKGTVLVRYNSSTPWGTLCGEIWDINNAKVVCRMLGYNDAVSPLLNYDRETLKSLPQELNYLNCTGKERNLAECRRSISLIPSSCEYEGLAGVICTKGWHEVRLIPPSSEPAARNKGTVLVRYNSTSPWGTICGNSWDINDAKVVCRMLGYPDALSHHFGTLEGYENVFDEVNCTGMESDLYQCRNNTYGSPNCGLGEQAGATCTVYEVSLEPPSRHPEAKNKGTVLVRLNSSSQWGTYCYNSWGWNAARVVCRMLGFHDAISLDRFSDVLNGSQKLLYGVTCKGTELNLAECSFNPSRLQHCKSDDLAGVTCGMYEARLEPPASDPRAVNKGIVLVRYNSTSPWGTICGRNWDIDDARVICRMLQFKNVTSHYTSSASGEQKDYKYILEEVNCTGMESNLFHCRNILYGTHGCALDEVAGVTCTAYEVMLVPPHNEKIARNTGVVLVRQSPTSSWGTMCSGDFYHEEADVVCRMLGFRNAISYKDEVTRAAPVGVSGVLDNVICRGGEKNLAECSGQLDKSVFCYGIIAVTCEGYEVKLEPPSDDPTAINKGTVLFRHSSSSLWGAICGNNWDLNDASVVCRMLGFHAAISHHKILVSGTQKQYIAQLDGVNCTGWESNLYQCENTQYGTYRCDVGQLAGVTCIWYEVMLEPPASEPTARNKGTVLVRHNSTSPWGVVCDDNWDINDAKIVCRMLGFNGAMLHHINSTFGMLAGITAVLNNVKCTGEERALAGCSSNLCGTHDCDSSKQAGVTCDWYEVKLDPPSSEPRAKHKGIVLVRYNSTSKWGTIGDKGWGINNARVVCRMLGFPGVNPNQESFPKTIRSEPPMLHNVYCTGTEMNLAECRSSRYGLQPSSIGERVGVTCEWYELKLETTPGEPRAKNKGMVLVRYNSTSPWGTICGNGWDINAAKVVCRMLGYPESASHNTSLALGAQNGYEVMLGELGCTGMESDLFQCKRSLYGKHDCGLGEQAGVICAMYEVRLEPHPKDPTASHRGTVLVRYNSTSQWGTICRDRWTDYDAMVVCRMLGFPGAFSVEKIDDNSLARFPIVLDDVFCTGQENNLIHCKSVGYGNHRCRRPRQAAVTCRWFEVKLKPLYGEKTTSNKGTVLIRYGANKPWGTVCGTGWSINMTQVVCRMLGFNGAISEHSDYRFDIKAESAVEVEGAACTGTERNLAECARIVSTGCLRDLYAGVTCDPSQRESLVYNYGNSTVGRGTMPFRTTVEKTSQKATTRIDSITNVSPPKMGVEKSTINPLTDETTDKLFNSTKQEVGMLTENTSHADQGRRKTGTEKPLSLNVTSSGQECSGSLPQFSSNRTTSFGYQDTSNTDDFPTPSKFHNGKTESPEKQISLSHRTTVTRALSFISFLLILW